MAADTGQAAVADWARRYFAQIYPEYLRVGPWHPVAKVFLCAYASVLLATSRRALCGGGSGEEGDDAEELCPKATTLLPPAAARAVRAAGSVWGCAVLALTFRWQGLWPLASYTMQSWTLMTLRYITGLLADLCGEEPSGQEKTARRTLLRVYEALRFPALAQNSVTVVVWWSAIVPVLSVALRKNEKRLAAFWRFNRMPMLVNVHLLNLPLAAVEHLAHPRRLVFRDLWLALATAGAYLSFYLGFLDPRGFHLYIILSPRTKLTGVVGAATLGLYVGLWRFWDGMAKRAAALAAPPPPEG